jgi:superfamily II DNA/RNA helicase
MSENLTSILDERLKAFFSREGQIADVMNLLSKRERFYLFARLNVAIADNDWESESTKLRLKIEAINSLILFIVEKPQLNEHITTARQNGKSLLVSLYELLYALSSAYVNCYEANSLDKFESLVFTAVTGVCADRTPEVAILIEDNWPWIQNLKLSELSARLRFVTFKFNLTLYARISNGTHIEFINSSEKEADQVLAEYQKQESQKDAIDLSSGFNIGTFGNFIFVLKNIKEYLFTGKTLSGDNITSLIETYVFNALKLSKGIESDLLSTIVHHSKYALEQLYKNSIWQIADRSPLIKSFFEKSIEKQDHLLLTLLPSQRKTVLEILTAKKSIVVNMPTSSGKSLLAELYILFTIQSQTFGDFKPTITYIVPTNALINQVKYKLRKVLGEAYKIESVLPFYEEDSLEEEILARNTHIDVLVTTPEKLDFLVRNERPVISNLKLVILDEAHNLSDKGRGSKFELLLSVIKQKKSDVNFLLLSPFIKNAKEIARWLGDSDENSVEVSITWTPTKQYIGCNTFNHDKSDSIITYFPSARNTIVDKPIEIPLGVNLIEIKKQLQATKIDSSVKIIGLLSKYLNVGDTTLVFCEGPGSAQKVAQKVKNYFSALGVLTDISITNEAIRRAITLIKFESKEDDPLIECLRYGVAYHHSQLSVLIKEEIERLLAAGLVKLVFATPTLAQGLNFPITTVIFDTTKLGKQSEDMPSPVFWNIAGRAGRAYMDSEGHVIIGYASNNAATISKTQSYIVDDIKKITSSLSEFFQSIDSQVIFDYQLVKNNPAVSNFLQYLNHIIKVTYHYRLETVDTSRIRTMLNNSLFYRQITFEQGFVETQRKVNDFAVGYVDYLKGQDTRQLNLADVFGISNISLNSVTARVIEHKEKIQAEFSGAEINNHLFASKIILDTKNVNDLAEVITILSRIPELKVNMREGGALDPFAVANVIIGWVNGDSISSIAQRTKKGKETDEDAVGICNKYINGNLRNYLPWGLNIYQTLTNDITTDSAKMLPSFVYYGVNTKESVILANLGVPRFIIPKVKQEFTARFNESITVENMESVRRKLKQIDDFGIGDNISEKKQIRDIIANLV